jgi:lipoate-protein ligase A
LNCWLLLDSGMCDAAFNMALDEALLQNVSRLGRPVLRFYGWTQPAATFGYFQQFAAVERATHLRPLIRRPTGGGIVPHDLDWTYSAVFPPHQEWHSLPAEESYRRIHDWLRLAFAKLDVMTELAGSRQHGEAQATNAAGDERQVEPSQSLLAPAATGIPGRCFVGHEKFDLLWHGKKIAGAAQRRNRLGLLIQGSVQPPPLPLPLKRVDFAAAMQAIAVEKLQACWTELAPDPGLRQHAETLAAVKYSQAGYNQKR